MGKPADIKSKPAPPQQYRDDPDAVSMHTTPDDYQYDDAPELPSYDDSEAAASTSREEETTFPPPPQDEYAPIQPPKAPTISQWRHDCGTTSIKINETTIRMDERLNDPDELHTYVRGYLAVVPPRPGVRITGWHLQKVERNKKTETEETVDFDMLFSLERYLPPAGPITNRSSEAGKWWTQRVATNGEKCHRGSWRKTRAPGYKQDVEVGETAEPSLGDWCRDFAQSKAKLKIFRVTRDLVGLDQEDLKLRLQTLVRSTGYRGHIDVTFPVHEKHVDIYSPHWINRWRVTWWVRWLFFLTFLWIITWPILFFMTKRWSVYNVDWRWSWSCSTGPEGSSSDAYSQRTFYASITEKTWFEKHQGLIRALALNKYQGDATDLPLNVRRESPGNNRVSSTGNANVDTAVSFVRGGVSAWNAIRSGQGVPRAGEAEWWGWDET
ncbi:hypothetical protein KC340_g4010 [Hortaea werneckii]|nr:hypothetical protein KC342_g4192 [Hortaea werneckii]KAI7330969.1 hypothetical protein KC340_g4010 [Hortaea werneckii]KAI7378701.1 hypothetical protein KC328_g13753 [Hortaea werneckii]